MPGVLLAVYRMPGVLLAVNRMPGVLLAVNRMPGVLLAVNRMPRLSRSLAVVFYNRMRSRNAEGPGTQQGV